MVDRHWLGDLALAVLLAFPLAMLARSHATPQKPSVVESQVQVALTDRTPGNGRISVLS